MNTKTFWRPVLAGEVAIKSVSPAQSPIAMPTFNKHPARDVEASADAEVEMNLHSWSLLVFVPSPDTAKGDAS
jgi:hypothetical protein